jgi:hypothetical protein
MLALLVLGCTEQESPKTDESASSLVVTSESASVSVEQNRVILSLRDGFARIDDAQAVYVKARDYQAEGEPIVWEGPASDYSSFELPYWVVYPAFTHPGAWLLELEITTAQGQQVNATLGVNVQEQAFGILPGQPAPASQTRTATNPDDLARITTADPPNPAFYQLTIEEAINNGQASLIVFSTPGLCATDACGPMMKTVEALWQDYSDQMNFIHVEVYESFEDPLQYVEAMREWGLINEPWVYLVDAEGIVNTRFDTVIAMAEIQPRLDELLQ